MQIGRLTELRQLNIAMVWLDEAREMDGPRRITPMLLPAMLSLGNTLEGRPGFLKHFSGLTKLETLSRSVRADTEEAKKTINWDEVNWIYLHWPKLKHAHFFGSEKEIRTPFLWLRERTHDRSQLKLTVESNELIEMLTP